MIDAVLLKNVIEVYGMDKSSSAYSRLQNESGKKMNTKAELEQEQQEQDVAFGDALGASLKTILGDKTTPTATAKTLITSLAKHLAREMNHG